MDVNRRAFVTADTHFGHLDAIEKFDRPFGDLSAMDEALLAGINEVVGEQDLLYHLGDFVGPTPKGVSRTDHARAMRERINCGNIVLIRGNHDPRRNPEFDALQNPSMHHRPFGHAFGLFSQAMSVVATLEPVSAIHAASSPISFQWPEVPTIKLYAKTEGGSSVVTKEGVPLNFPASS